MEALLSPTRGYYPQTLSQGPHIDSCHHQPSQAGPGDESPQQRFQPQARARSRFWSVAVGWSDDCGLGVTQGRSTHIVLGHLGQVHLVCQVTVAHAIFITISSSPGCTGLDHMEIFDVASILHLEIHANAPIHCCAWAADVQICDSAFDDFGEDFPRALIGRHPDSGLVSWVQILADDRG